MIYSWSSQRCGAIIRMKMTQNGLLKALWSALVKLLNDLNNLLFTKNSKLFKRLTNRVCSASDLLDLPKTPKQDEIQILNPLNFFDELNTSIF